MDIEAKATELSPITKAAIDRAVHRALAVHRRTNPLTGSEWADQYFYLSEESSLIKGQWETLCWQVGMLNAMTNDDIRGVFVKKSKRTGFTKMILATVGYYVGHKARKIGIWQPTDGDAKEFSLVELDTMIRDVEPVRVKFPYFEKKSSRNTVSFKQFYGTPVYIKGGKSAKNFRRMTLDVAILDELSAFDADVENEGSALKLAEGRTEGSPFRKLIAGSTPKVKGECQIDAACDDADASFHYYWPCPHCGHEQVLRFGGRDTDYGFKWLSGQPQSVQYQCEECSCLVTQEEFNAALTFENCRWKDALSGIWTRDGEQFFSDADVRVDTPRYVAFHIWAGYSPLVQWWEIVSEWLKSCRDPIKTKTFLNTSLGETYDIASGDQADKTMLHERATRGNYGTNPVPERICYVTAGVDVQPDRFEVQFLGWGVGAECWVLHYVVLPCDTSIKSAWDELLDVSLDRVYTHPSGKRLSVSFVGVDTGFATQQAYRYCKDFEHKGRLALKGMSGERPIMPLRPSLNWSYKGLKGWLVGTDTAKTQIYQRLSIVTPGQGFIHFPSSGLPEDYFDQLTAEKRRMRINKAGRREYYWWKPDGVRVEVLDTFVYAVAALEHSGVDLGLAWDRMMEVQKEIDFSALARAMNS